MHWKSKEAQVSVMGEDYLKALHPACYNGKTLKKSADEPPPHTLHPCKILRMGNQR